MKFYDFIKNSPIKMKKNKGKTKMLFLKWCD